MITLILYALISTNCIGRNTDFVFLPYYRTQLVGSEKSLLTQCLQAFDGGEPGARALSKILREPGSLVSERLRTLVSKLPLKSRKSAAVHFVLCDLEQDVTPHIRGMTLYWEESLKILQAKPNSSGVTGDVPRYFYHLYVETKNPQFILELLRLKTYGWTSGWLNVLRLRVFTEFPEVTINCLSKDETLLPIFVNAMKYGLKDDRTKQNLKRVLLARSKDNINEKQILDGLSELTR